MSSESDILDRVTRALVEEASVKIRAAMRDVPVKVGDTVRLNLELDVVFEQGTENKVVVSSAKLR